MTDKILCPWCGAEMRTITVPLEKNGKTKKWNAWMACKNIFACQAEGPFVQASTLEEAMDSAKAAALRRYTPPLKPMPFEEVERIVRSDDLNDEMPMYFEDADGDNGWEISYKLRRLLYNASNDYGKTWRCWERKPTDEERSAAEWE